ncbi:hypothetical protein F0919_18115 [Taibaiella lutea]|uniref:Uncharacterized protein n=1 Tax=Taibaiella lutea TaxID=2608001 RepID=A0A5M6CC34_9BACT|nr:hypothetical protein [Taibaiella lutea]KAA5532696.1 hypothetical protein F0919_18115 [Taibaiella lutea]
MAASFKNTDEEISFCLKQVSIYSNRATLLLKRKEEVSTSSPRKGKRIKKQYLSDEQRDKLYQKAIS